MLFRDDPGLLIDEHQIEPVDPTTTFKRFNDSANAAAKHQTSVIDETQNIHGMF